MNKNAIYLVVDPGMERAILLSRLAEAVGTGKICAVQIWDHWQDVQEKDLLVRQMLMICREAEVPLLINNDWQLLKDYELDGIHLDKLPEQSLATLKQGVGRQVLIGVTLGNDLSRLESPELLDYVSFCSVFPSSSAGACEIVSYETIRELAELTDLPVFLSGGINLSTIPQLAGLPFHGLAVISGIMASERPAEAVLSIDQSLKNLKKHS